jgi:DNA invertase Pin-like site-specific DNA recombinase
MLQHVAAIAELEAGMISVRTRAALAAAKRRGVKLRGFRGRAPSAKDVRTSVAARRAKAQTRAGDLAPMV